MDSMAAVSVDNGPTPYMSMSDTAVRYRQRVLISEYIIVWDESECVYVCVCVCVCVCTMTLRSTRSRHITETLHFILLIMHVHSITKIYNTLHMYMYVDPQHVCILYVRTCIKAIYTLCADHITLYVHTHIMHTFVHRLIGNELATKYLYAVINLRGVWAIKV